MQTARSRRAERGFLTDVSLPWGQQVALMFQIVCALFLDVPGVSPNVVLPVEPWGQDDHIGAGCGCFSIERTGAYVYELTIGRSTSISQPTSGEAGGPGELGDPVAASMIASSGKVHSVRPLRA